MSDDDVNEFAKNLLAAKRADLLLYLGGNLTDDDPCAICTDQARNQTVIPIVEDSRDVSAMEISKNTTYLYHVLHPHFL